MQPYLVTSTVFTRFSNHTVKNRVWNCDNQWYYGLKPTQAHGRLVNTPTTQHHARIPNPTHTSNQPLVTSMQTKPTAKMLRTIKHTQVNTSNPNKYQTSKTNMQHSAYSTSTIHIIDEGLNSHKPTNTSRLTKHPPPDNTLHKVNPQSNRIYCANKIKNRKPTFESSLTSQPLRTHPTPPTKPKAIVSKYRIPIKITNLCLNMQTPLNSSATLNQTGKRANPTQQDTKQQNWNHLSKPQAQPKIHAHQYKIGPTQTPATPKHPTTTHLHDNKPTTTLPAQRYTLKPKTRPKHKNSNPNQLTTKTQKGNPNLCTDSSSKITLPQSPPFPENSTPNPNQQVSNIDHNKSQNNKIGNLIKHTHTNQNNSKAKNPVNQIWPKLPLKPPDITRENHPTGSPQNHESNKTPKHNQQSVVVKPYDRQPTHRDTCTNLNTTKLQSAVISSTRDSKPHQKLSLKFCNLRKTKVNHPTCVETGPKHTQTLSYQSTLNAQPQQDNTIQLPINTLKPNKYPKCGKPKQRAQHAETYPSVKLTEAPMSHNNTKFNEKQKTTNTQIKTKRISGSLNIIPQRSKTGRRKPQELQAHTSLNPAQRPIINPNTNKKQIMLFHQSVTNLPQHQTMALHQTPTTPQHSKTPNKQIKTHNQIPHHTTHNQVNRISSKPSRSVPHSQCLTWQTRCKLGILVNHTTIHKLQSTYVINKVKHKAKTLSYKPHPNSQQTKYIGTRKPVNANPQACYHINATNKASTPTATHKVNYLVGYKGRPHQTANSKQLSNQPTQVSDTCNFVVITHLTVVNAKQNNTWLTVLRNPKVDPNIIKPSRFDPMRTPLKATYSNNNIDVHSVNKLLHKLSLSAFITQHYPAKVTKPNSKLTTTQKPFSNLHYNVNTTHTNHIAVHHVPKKYHTSCIHPSYVRIINTISIITQQSIKHHHNMPKYYIQSQCNNALAANQRCPQHLKWQHLQEKLTPQIGSPQENKLQYPHKVNIQTDLSRITIKTTNIIHLQPTNKTQLTNNNTNKPNPQPTKYPQSHAAAQLIANHRNSNPNPAPNFHPQRPKHHKPPMQTLKQHIANHMRHKVASTYKSKYKSEPIRPAIHESHPAIIGLNPRLHM
eukprot:gene3416-2367_t